MLNSLEVRSLFLSHKVVNKAFELPIEFKLRNKTTKYILKDILSEFFPKSFVYRPKMGFAIPIERWIRDRKFKSKISEIFYESEWNKLGYDKKKLIEKWENYKRYRSVTPQCIWMYTIAGMWLNSLRN